MDGTNYHLLCLSEGLRAAITRTHFQDTLCTQRHSSSSGGGETDPSSDGSSSAGAARQGEDMPKFDTDPDDGPRIGDPHPEIGPPKEKLEATSTRVNPGTYLARRFTSKWARAKMRSPELRITRALDPGPASNYINKTMLGTNGLSPDHVEAYMDAFVEAAVAGEVIIEEGQFAFQRFIPWWGRTDVEDPTERAQGKALAQWAVEQVRRQRGEIG